MSDGGVYRVPFRDNIEYVDYLRSIERRRPEYTLFREYLERNSKGDIWYQEDGETGHVQFHDTLSDNSILPPLSLKADENLDIKEMENIISNPPASLRSRLIVVGLKHRKIVNQGVLDLLRLKFDIEPAFFWSLLSAEESPVVVPRLRGFLRMDYMTLKILRNFPSASGEVSVAIIAIDEGSLPRQMKNVSRNLDPFLFTLHEQSDLSDFENPRIELDFYNNFDLFQTFGSLLGTQQNVSSEEDLLQCLLLVARTHLATFRQATAESAIDEADKVDRERWYHFRETLVHFQDDLRAFSRYVKREFHMSVLPEPLQKTLEVQEDLLAEAQALETLLRDLMQANVGVQSLKESRMSMEEGKRNKLLTILAFIFIPTTLASSVFGMNVQEINNTGKSIWTFAATALSLTGAAVTAWFLSGLARAKWHSRDNEPDYLTGVPDYSRKRRFRHAMWLLSNPNTWNDMPWGTLLGVVTNNRFGRCIANYEVDLARSRQILNAQREILRFNQSHPPAEVLQETTNDV